MATILIVDDDQSTQLLMRRMLGHLDVEIVGATRCSDALRLASELVPDVILMDILLPGSHENGWTTAKTIRDDPQLKHIPIIIVSAVNIIKNSTTEHQYEGYFQKPFQVRDLLDCIRALVKD